MSGSAATREDQKFKIATPIRLSDRAHAAKRIRRSDRGDWPEIGLQNLLYKLSAPNPGRLLEAMQRSQKDVCLRTRRPFILRDGI